MNHEVTKALSVASLRSATTKVETMKGVVRFGKLEFSKKPLTQRTTPWSLFYSNTPPKSPA